MPVAPKIQPAFFEKLIRGEFKAKPHHDLAIKIVKVKGKQVTLSIEVIDQRDGPLLQLAQVTAQQDDTVTLQGVGNCFNITQSYA